MFTKRMLIAFASVGMSVLISDLAYSNPPVRAEIEYLGQTELGHFFSDSDVVEFGGCNGPQNEFVQSVQLRVEKSVVEIDELVLQYGNGQTSTVSVRDTFNPGTQSRLIDLPGGERCVTRAFIRGKTMSFGSQGVVKFFGYRFRHLPPPPRHTSLLGTTFLEYERDADRIFISECDRYSKKVARKLQLQITNNDARIFDIKVRFGNGEVVEIPVRDFFAEGSWTVEKDLPGDLRCIQEIYVIGRTVANHRGYDRAQIRVYGLN
jgi:hypothetical protein